MERSQIIEDNATKGQTKPEYYELWPGGRNVYSNYLESRGISYSNVSPYLLAGHPDEKEVWLIHISVVRQQFDQLIRPLLEFLKSEKIPFAIPAGADEHSSILDGRNGFALTGKVITIWVRNNREAEKIVNSLFALTKNIIGPAIPCAYHLNKVIAVEYGSMFTQQYAETAKTSIFYGSAIAYILQQAMKANSLHWPFRNIRPLTFSKQSRLLKRQYIPIDTYKSDPKGNVIKAVKINALYNMQWCILKQGRQYQSFDIAGRDGKDRLKWQFKIHQHFQNYRVLPRPLEYFEILGDGFFAMEYVESVSLAEKAVQLSEGHTWRSMPADNKRQLIGYLLQIARILDIFHEEGFVHRDVTAANFIVTATGQVFAIDIELCNDIRNSAPNPPFTFGTPGYISPAQQNGETPIIEDDIYSFGALLISVLTGILPNKLNHSNTESLSAALAWFLESSSLVCLITACLRSDPALRPSLENIKTVLEVYDSVLLTYAKDKCTAVQHVSRANLGLLRDGIYTICGILNERINTLPRACTLSTPYPTDILKNPFSYDRDFMPLFVLALARKFTTRVAESTVLTYTIDFLLEKCTGIVLPGLELQILAAELSGNKQDAEHMLTFMTHAVAGDEQIETNAPNGISRGIAGKGLKLLHLIKHTDFSPDPRELARIVNRLLSLQQADGSWDTFPVLPNRKGYKVTGFSHGVAGIAFFLLQYFAINNSENLKLRIVAALNWLCRQRRSNNGKLIWTVSVESNTIDPWLEHGFSGVALTFIKAYEVLGNVEYKQIATEVLAHHPAHITSNYCSFGNGLAGLGEVYLEAYLVFQDEEWHQRAKAIREVLFNSCYRDHDTCYWLDGTQLDPTPDFWTGNSGVLHFLLRYAYPGHIHFPSHLIK